MYKNEICVGKYAKAVNLESALEQFRGICEDLGGK